MKRIFKYILLIFLFCPVMGVLAVNSDDVYYDVKSLYIDAKIRNNGDIDVKELISLNGTFNGYEREINFNYKDDGKLIIDGLDVSSYKPSGIKNINVGIIKSGDSPSFDSINKKATMFKESSASNGDSGKFSKKTSKNGVSIKMYNETIDSTTSFYIAYTLTDAITQHNDISELLYPFLGDKFEDNIGKVEVHVTLPSSSNNLLVFGHGNLVGKVEKINNNTVKYTTTNLKHNTSLTTRVLFDNQLVTVKENKKSKIDAYDKIVIIESKFEENTEKKLARIELMKKLTKVFTYIYYVVLAGLTILVYVKFDKEYNSKFKEKYNRNFVEDYGVETVEYIMNKKITQSSFNACILNLIYKKKIKVDKIEASSKFSKDDYSFKLIDNHNLNSSEEKIVNMIFSKSNNKEITLSELQKYAKHTTLAGVNSFLNDFELWKKEALRESEYMNFYEDSKVPMVFAFVIFILTGILVSLQLFYNVFPVSIVIEIVLAIITIVYYIMVKKRSKKGIEHYAKWKSFKRFLLDFGRFDEKDLPEVIIWDKYLVYATALGVADKVSKTLKMKFEKYGTAYTGYLSDTYNNYLLFNVLNNEFNNSFTLAHQEVAKMVASGVGSGGGFSSGGFSGGGGGHGF